jgi:hypothetical protein
MVIGALHFTSKEKLNLELGWKTIMKRGDFLGLNLFHEVHLHETRPLVRKCMPKLDLEKKHETRSTFEVGYTVHRVGEMIQQAGDVSSSSGNKKCYGF